MYVEHNVPKPRRLPPVGEAPPAPEPAPLAIGSPVRLVAHLLVPMVAVLSLALWLVFRELPTSEEAARRAHHVTPTSYHHLEHALRKVRGAWLDADRAAAVADVKRRMDVLRTPMLWVLQRPDWPQFVEVANLAGQVGLAEFERPLREAAVGAVPMPVRQAAWRAIERLRPLSDQELGALMVHDGEPLQLLGLELAAARATLSPVVLDSFLGLLASPSRRVREAAREALPAQIPSTHAPLLLPLLGNAELRLGAVEALTRVRPAADAATLLARELGGCTVDTACAVLAVVDPLAHEPAIESRLWMLVRDAADAHLRVAALACIERCNLDATPLPHDLFTESWSQPAQVLAARLRLRAGDRGAVDRLLKLAEASGGDGADYARHAARVTLAAISGKSPHESAENLRAACATATIEPGKVALPAVPPY